MDKLIFTDKELRPLEEGAAVDKRFVVDCGKLCVLAGDLISSTPVHLYVSAFPVVQGVNRRQAFMFARNLLQANPNCKDVGLLTMGQIGELNYWGKRVGFAIRNTWTASCDEDWHGRIDGYYSMKDGRFGRDWGEQVTDLYVYFAFEPGQESPIFIG